MMLLFVDPVDGTADLDGPGESRLKCRRCAMDNHGRVDSLLAEMRSRRKSDRLPWENKTARDAAAQWVLRMSWLNGRTRSALVRHIGCTPYLEDSNQISPIRFVNTKGEPDFAYYHAARTHPAWGPFMDDLRAEAARLASGQATGAEPVPYASRKVRDEQAERIKKAKDLTEEDRAMLLAHVALTPYLQATYPAPAPN